jgi:DNA-binding NarL/FixJ family response regulator
MVMIKVAIIEDNSTYRENLCLYLDKKLDTEVISSASSMTDYEDKIGNLHPDIILLDIGLPQATGLSLIKKIKIKHPAGEIIMLTSYEDEVSIFTALTRGASAYLTKRISLAKIYDAILIVHRGGSFMSPEIAKKVINHFSQKKSNFSLLSARQAQIVQRIVEGDSYKMIAQRLDLSLETIRSYIKDIYKKLGVHSKSEIITRYYKKDL